MRLFESTPLEKSKIGITLAGGGARGIAHAGVLQALEENGIAVERISGASMGAIVGAFYADGLSPKAILEILEKPRFFRAFSLGIPDGGLTDMSYLKKMLKSNIKEDDFDSLQKPLYVCVSNINTGVFEIIDSGKLSLVVMASSSIPLIFKPVRMNGALYVDGGLLNNLPVEPIKATCEITIGVNVNDYGAVEQKIEGLWAIGERCSNLMVWENVQKRVPMCDIYIDVKAAYSFGVFDFKLADKIFEAGYTQTQTQMPDILKKINAKLKKNPLLKFWGNS
jgi:NTE family protein